MGKLYFSANRMGNIPDIRSREIGNIWQGQLRFKIKTERKGKPKNVDMEDFYGNYERVFSFQISLQHHSPFLQI